MARLFVTPRELDLISDITKEFVTDVVGQRVFVYRVNTEHTPVHDVYEESDDKVFDPPIELEALVEFTPENVRTNMFGSEERFDLTVFAHDRTLRDKNVTVEEGDYLQYGEAFFEIVSNVDTATMFGQVEHVVGQKWYCKQARRGLIDFELLGPVEDTETQREFVQQRGLSTNRLGRTNDVRQLQEDGKLTSPIEGQAEVSPSGGESSSDSSFYSN